MGGNIGQLLCEMFNVSWKEDQEFRYSLIFLLDVVQQFLEFSLEHFAVVVDVLFIEGRVWWNFHGEFLKFFEQGVV